MNPFHVDDIAWIVAEKLSGSEFHVLEFGSGGNLIPGLKPGKDYRYSDLPLFWEHREYTKTQTLLVINTNPKPLPATRFIKDKKGRIYFKYADKWYRIRYMPKVFIPLIEEGLWILTDIDNYPSRWAVAFYDARETSQLFTPNMNWPVHIIDGRDYHHGGGSVYTYKLAPKEVAAKFPPKRVREVV